MAPKIHFELANKDDCAEVLVLIKSYWPDLFAQPAPTPDPTPTPTPDPTPVETPDPIPTPDSAPAITAQDTGQVTEPPVTTQGEDYTRDQLQNMIRGYLTQFKGDDEKMAAAKKGLIDVLLKVAGVGSSATVPEEKMNETYLAVQQHIEEQPF